MAASPAPVRLTRRSFLAVSAAGLALAAAGCTSSGAGEAAEPVTAAQVDSLADQVAAQESLVAAYAAATSAGADLGPDGAVLTEQVGQQLERLRAASPDSGSSASSSASAPAVDPDPRVWLREQVTATADSHAAACREQTGARAALLGSVAAGLRGHAVRLA